MKRAIFIILCIAIWVFMSHKGFCGSPMIQKASLHIPVFREVLTGSWKGAPLPHIMLAQIEQESGWRTNAKLETKRELGRGLAQMTITSRFNIYKEAVKMKGLEKWDWEKDPYNVKYQLTFLVKQDRSNFASVKQMFSDDTQRWAGALVAYNAGMGTVLQRRANAKATGREYSKWFMGLDGAFSKYEQRLLYGRKLGLMRNEYPHLIINIRAPKYKGLL